MRKHDILEVVILKDENLQFSTNCTSPAFVTVENDALSVDLVGGQMEMGKFNHHKISIGTLRMYLFCPLISLHVDTWEERM